MTIHDKDLATLFALAVAVVPPLIIARKNPRLGILLLILACVAAPIAVGFGVGARSFAKLRLLAWGVFAGFPVGALGIALLTRKTSKPYALFSLVAAFAMLGVYGFAFHVEPHRLEVNHYEITTTRLDEPLRVVLIADIQTDDIGEHERRALRAAREAQPDIVMMAGDYLQCSSQGQLAKQRPLFRQLLNEPPLRAPLGVHAVAGNCEYGWDWTPIFDGTNVSTYGDTTTIDVGPLKLTLLGFQDGRLGKTIERDDERFHIVMGHYPDFASRAPVDADLLLAGHCHGGQVRVPGFGPPITLSSVPRDWTQGMTELEGGRKLIVSRGIGMERGHAPRLRFLCRPEVIVIDLVPAQETLAGTD
jgi:uncharacterized protein